MSKPPYNVNICIKHLFNGVVCCIQCCWKAWLFPWSSGRMPSRFTETEGAGMFCNCYHSLILKTIKSISCWCTQSVLVGVGLGMACDALQLVFDTFSVRTTIHGCFRNSRGQQGGHEADSFRIINTADLVWDVTGLKLVERDPPHPLNCKKEAELVNTSSSPLTKQSLYETGEILREHA